MARKPQLDFRAIKARVPILEVLARYGIELRQRDKEQMVGACPLPQHDPNGKNNAPFSVNVVRNIWRCFSCETRGKASGNILDLVSAMESISVFDSAKRLDDWFPANGNPATESVVNQLTTDETPIVNKPLAFELKDVTPTHELIQSRGISAETAKLFGIGFFPGAGSMKGRIVFKLHEDSNLVGYAGRALAADHAPKWLLPKNFVKSFVYALERCDPAKPLILGESFWLPAFMHERGAQAASLMGSEMTEEQERRLDPFPVITVAFDNDATGMEKAARVIERLKVKHRVLKARLIE